MKPSPGFCSCLRNELRGTGAGLELGAWQPQCPSAQGGPALPRSGVGTKSQEAATEMPSTGLHMGMAKVDLSKM